MADYKKIEDVKLEGQRTFMRVDFNILDKEGSVGSTKRIKASLPSIKYAAEKGAKLIIASHVQRPDGKVVEKWRTALIAKELEKMIGKKVSYVNECVGPKVEAAVNEMKNGDILMLENLRFYSGEEKNNTAFAEQLAKFIDIYVLDGFAAAHRAHASTVALPLYLIEKGKQVVAGKLMKHELDYWGVIATGKPGGVAIIGGAKLKEKIKVAANFPKLFDKVVLGGVVANVFLKAAGKEIGASKYTEKDKDYTEKAKSALEKYSNIVLPTRVVLDDGSEIKVEDIPAEKSAVDALLEESTLKSISSAPRVVIFGTMGMFEDGYTKGTDQIVSALSDYKGLLRIGGGDAEKAFKGKIDAPISTGGGASIEYIINGKLPGLEALKGNTAYFKK